MTLVKLVNLCRELLNVLSEMETGKAYDLAQLADHVDASNLTELKRAATSLRNQGCVELIKMEQGLFIAFRNMAFDPGLVTDNPVAPEDVGLSANINTAPISAASRVNVAPLEKPKSRINVNTPLTVSETETNPAPVSNPAVGINPIGELTIKQVLASLAGAIDQSSEIDPKVKYPLLEKLGAITDQPEIEKWLTTPLKNMVQ